MRTWGWTALKFFIIIQRRAYQYIQLQNQPEQPISHTHEKKSAGVPPRFPKFTEAGVPNSEKEGRKGNKKGKGGKRARKQGWQCEFCSSVNTFPKAESTGTCIWAVFKNTGQLGGWGVTALLSYTAGTSVQNHMRSPKYEQELIWGPAMAEWDMLEADEKPWMNVDECSCENCHSHWFNPWCKSTSAHIWIHCAHRHIHTLHAPIPSIKLLHTDERKWDEVEE